MRPWLPLISLSASLANASAAMVLAPPSEFDRIGFAPRSAVRPGDDFDAFANDPWRSSVAIPDDRSQITNFDIVRDRATARISRLVGELKASDPAPGTQERLIVDYFDAFTDEQGIAQRGLAPLEPRRAEIAAIRSRADLAAYLGRDLQADVDPLNAGIFTTSRLFGLYVTQALDAPAETVPYLLQGGLGMPNRNYYLDDSPEMQRMRREYALYVERLLSAGGVANGSTRARRVVDLETKIAAASADLATSSDLKKAANRWRREDFSRRAPGLEWRTFFKQAGLGPTPFFMVWQPAAISRLSALAGGESIDTWKDWLLFHELDRAAPYLPASVAKLKFAFFGQTLEGIKQAPSRTDQAIADMNNRIGDAIGEQLSHRYMSPGSKAAARAMVRNIQAAFGRRIEKLAWMSPQTKKRAKAKLATLYVGLGYPERWRSFDGLAIRPDDPFGNAVRAQAYETKRQIAKIGTRPNAAEWWMNAQATNAQNQPLQNSITFPMAYLEPPFFDPVGDAAVNYGGLGAVIGHEIVHSFDVLGSSVDGRGRLINWWTDADLRKFHAEGRRLVQQYAAYEPLPGMHVDGEQTLNENLADVAGLAAAYDAYQAQRIKGQPDLIGGLTGDQRFFLAYAQFWRAKLRPAALRKRLATDSHAPAPQRVWAVRNNDAWYRAFNIRPGDKLYLNRAARINIW